MANEGDRGWSGLRIDLKNGAVPEVRRVSRVSRIRAGVRRERERRGGRGRGGIVTGRGRTRAVRRVRDNESGEDGDSSSDADGVIVVGGRSVISGRVEKKQNPKPASYGTRKTLDRLEKGVRSVGVVVSRDPLP